MPNGTGKRRIIQRTTSQQLDKTQANHFMEMLNDASLHEIIEYYSTDARISKKIFSKQLFLLEYHLSSFFIDKKRIQIFMIDLSTKVEQSSKKVLPLFKSKSDQR